MRFTDVVIPAGGAWSSPFLRWQGPAADINSLDLAEQVTRDALGRSGVQWPIREVVLGLTVPQRHSFFGTPTLSARLGFTDVSGPLVMQACATSAASLQIGASGADADGEARLVVTTDRTSNAPLVVYPGGRRPGGSPETEEWQLDNFACDPLTSESMLDTGERVAAEAPFAKAELDELAARRYEQYLDALRDERAFQRDWMVPIRAGSRRKPIEIDADWGVRPVELEQLRALAPVQEGGGHSYGTQTHPADASAGIVLTTSEGAVAAGVGVLARVLSSGFGRAARGEMPKATVPAARIALRDAGLHIGQVNVIKTHNPFAVNDLWLARELGVDAWAINPFGSSLIYGHPQGPTGMRAIVELIYALRARGGGIGLFTGCAAGDTGGAIVVRVDD